MTKETPYFLLIITAITLFVIRFFVGKKNYIIVNIYDTYFVVSLKYAIISFGILFLFFGVFYWILEKYKFSLYAILSNIHIFGTVILSFLFFFFNYKNIQKLNQKTVFTQILNSVDYNSYLIFCLMAIIFLQFLFIINIFVSLLKK
jgi:heme/copper-type cytochrome/quinol oxidase subunit 1